MQRLCEFSLILLSLISYNTHATYSVSAAKVAPASVSPGSSIQIAASLKSTVAVNNQIIDLEIYDASGKLVAQKYFTKQNLSANQALTYSWNYTLASNASAGMYKIKAGVFTANWRSNPYWNDGAASFVVAIKPIVPVPPSPPPPAPTPSPTPTPVPPVGSGAIERGVYITFYGFDDNDDGSGNYGVSNISNPIIHQVATEDLGTFARPSTFATDLSIAAPGTKIYIPRLHKYYIMEDTCRECTADAHKGLVHVDLYIGGNTAREGQPLIDCEDGLTNTPGTDVIVVNPDANWPVNTGMIFTPATGNCNMSHFPVP